MSNDGGEKALVLGLARSGLAAATALLNRDVKVVATDLETSPMMQERARHLRQLGAEVVLGGHPFCLLEQADYVVVSPGIPDTAPILQEGKRRQCLIISEPELAYWFHQGPYLAVTGSNGKTTTITWLGEVLAAANITAVIGGNIGRPLTDAVTNLNPGNLVVAELSSFQLQYTHEFQPHICAILNISEDHLDRHRSFTAYVAAKAKIFARQGPEDILVLNADDKCCRDLALAACSRTLFFSRKQPLAAGAWVENGSIMLKWPEPDPPKMICSVPELAIPGAHNVENALAVACLARAAGANADCISNILKYFPGLEHRCEKVAVIAGVQYINDSKGTNPEATLKAIGAFAPPIILIAGGRAKGTDFRLLVPAIKERCRSVILIGEAAGEIRLLLDQAGFRSVYQMNSLPAAVKLAHRLASPGATVLLSPSCASFDMFSSYEQRGQVFKRAVKELRGEKA
ncbi:MAG TPA: UDP-N-acetylmuramoyl-L-alanine--D-glutamate ligase [bacterium]|nr:UDP-N-acetylmuramoyl-L-alanine--D-glutamate ligase [bacterium]